jgi:hypothetical protein
VETEDWAVILHLVFWWMYRENTIWQCYKKILLFDVHTEMCHYIIYPQTTLGSIIEIQGFTEHILCVFFSYCIFCHSVSSKTSKDHLKDFVLSFLTLYYDISWFVSELLWLPFPEVENNLVYRSLAKTGSLTFNSFLLWNKKNFAGQASCFT